MQNKCITILLATANRPQFLRQALASVRDQTIRHRIAEVIVSENGGNRASAGVVAEFPELPVRYIFRDPPTIPLEHGKFMLKQPLAEFTAILHDDDWWMPEHLENAIRELDAHSNAAAYYSNCFLVPGTSAVLACDDNLYCWFGAGFQPFTPIWELSLKQVILAALLATPAIFSTSVYRSGVLQQASNIYWMDNSFDIDRMLIVELATSGSILYRPYPEVFIRRHAGQDTEAFSQGVRNRRMEQTTDWIIRKCGKDLEEITEQFMDLIERCPREARNLLYQSVMMPWCAPRLFTHNSNNKRLAKFLSQQKLALVRKRIKDFIPPILQRAVKRIVG